jgi:hypothetical protein
MTVTNAERQKAYRARRKGAFADLDPAEQLAKLDAGIDKMARELRDDMAPSLDRLIERQAILILIDELWQTRAMNSTARMRLREMVSP